MKILMTGGHLTPALAVISVLRQRYKRTKVVFVGRRYAQEKEQMLSRERAEIEKRQIPYYEVTAAKFHRTYFWRNVQEFARFLPSLKQVHHLLRVEKPDVLLSFGGYLAMPVALLSKLYSIPIITHEQTKTAGLANQWIAKFADAVAVSHEDSKKYFPREKTTVTGNPVRSAFLQKFRIKPKWLTRIPLTKPVIYITGGSQGSHVLNITVAAILPELLKRAVVVHQCGPSANSAYVKELEAIRAELPAELRRRYVPKEWIAEEDVAWLFQHADLVVSRAGANTVQEIVVSKVPALFVPLPFAHNNEQWKNAQWLAEHGSAIILSQKDLLPSLLLDKIRESLKKAPALRKRAKQLATESLSATAAESIIRLCQRTYAAHH